MTSPLSASENTSPAFPVRSSEDPHVLKNDPPPLPAPIEAITPGRSVASGKPKLSPLALVLALDGLLAYEDERAQLSERESIFATHYTTSDSASNTPILPPTVEGRYEDIITHQDVLAEMELPVARSSHPPELPTSVNKTRSSSTIASIEGIEGGHEGQQGRDTGPPATGSVPLGLLAHYRTKGGSLARMDRVKSVPNLPPFLDPIPTVETPPSTSRHKIVTSPMPGEAQKDTDWRESRDERLYRREQSTSVAEERSSSRNDKGYVEKKIEATLANAEPAQNARSRKTSHYLGLFKENTPSQEHRRRGESSAEKPSKEKASELEDQARLHDAEVRTARAHQDHQGPIRQDGKLISDASRADGLGRTEQRLTLNHENDMHQQASDIVSPQPSYTKHMVDISNKPTTDDEESAQRSITRDDGTVLVAGHEAAHTFPLRLLEEIRNHHNLTPGGARGTSFSRSIRTISAERAQLSSSNNLPEPGYGHGSESTGDDERPQSQETRDNEDEDESDKEQISSALYFPHQTPSLDAIERVDSGESTRIDSNRHHSLSSGSDVELLKYHKTEHPKCASNEVDIDLQSSDEHRYLHGDLQQPLLPAPSSGNQPYAILSEVGPSASNSDYESLDETAYSSREDEQNLTDDADTTPTATPIANAPLTQLKSRRTRESPPAPLGAVELKPYNHQVGGHTTVFRFSRRAVCKQLSNRENEFYETIERKHPELLRFLPRYAWLFQNLSEASKLRHQQRCKTSLSTIFRTLVYHANVVLLVHG